MAEEIKIEKNMSKGQNAILNEMEKTVRELREQHLTNDAKDVYLRAILYGIKELRDNDYECPF